MKLNNLANKPGNRITGEDATPIYIDDSDDIKHILILDDYFFGRERLRTSLAKSNRQIDLAKDGNIALEMLLKKSYSLFLTDLTHDGITGQDLIKEIRNRKLPTAIVISSSDHTLKSIEAALAAGADDYILKPYNLKRLETVIERLITKKALDTPTNTDYNHEETFIINESRGRLADPKNESSLKVPTIPEDKRPEYLAELLATVPNDAGYAEQAQNLEGLTRDFKRQVASRLLPALKDEMQRKPHGTHDDKKELVKWVNAELRRFSLAFKSPKTGTAASFVADKGNNPAEGRFQLRSQGQDGKAETFSTPNLVVLLDALELTDAPQREEGLANWADRAKPARPARR